MAKPLPDPNLPWPIIMEAVYLCSDKEDLRLKAYKCIAGKWTCGWGETDGVKPGMVWTKEYADKRFCEELTEITDKVKGLCTEHPSDHELGAMVVLTYNIGVGAFAKSTVLRLHNKGDKMAASRAFSLFNKFHDPAQGGKLVESNGLTIRRVQEAAIYVTSDVDTPSTNNMPQVVAVETNLAKSPINAGGTAALGSGIFTMAAQYGDQTNSILHKIKETADTVGVSLPIVLGIVLVIAGAAVIYWRFKQRSGGWV